MTREEAKKAAEVMLAYADGKDIESRKRKTEGWFDCQAAPSFDWVLNDYRVKPQTTYRPFHDAEECWQEMKKHQPFGWVKYDKMGSTHLITYLYDKRATFDSGCLQSFKIAFQKGYTFVDGTPFGIKEGGEG